MASAAWVAVPEAPASAWKSVAETRRDSVYDAAAGFASGAGDVVSGVANSVIHPIDALNSLLRAHKEQFEAGADSFKKGNYVEGVQHFAGGALPAVGPMISDFLDSVGDPNVDTHQLARKLGQISTTLAAPKIAGKAAEAIPGVAATVVAATDPAIVRAAVKVLPHGQAIVDTADQFTAARAKLMPKNQGPVPVLRDANSPAWAGIPEPQAAAPAPVEPIASQLPSGRVPGGIQNQVETPEAESAAAPATPKAPVVVMRSKATVSALDQIAREGIFGKKYKDFASAPSAAQTIIESVYADSQSAPAPISLPSPQATPVASRVAVPAPQAAPSTIADFMRDTSKLEEIVRQKQNGVSTPRAIADGMYARGVATGADAAAVYEAAGRAAKAQSLSQMLYDEGLTSAKVSKWNARQWADAVHDRGMPKAFSPASIAEVMIQLRKLESGE